MAYDKDFYIKLAQEAGASPETVQALQQADDKFLKALSDRVLAKDEFSRNMDGLRTQEKALNDKLAGLDTWYKTAVEAFNVQKSAEDQARAQLKAYMDTYGELPSNPTNPNGHTNPVTGDWVSKKDFDETLDKLSMNAVNLMSTLTTDALDYFQKFNERLDTNALVKYAQEKGMPLAAAYDSFIAPKLAERTQKEWETKVQQARDEGAKAALAQHRLPVDSRPSEPSFLFHKPKPEDGVPTTPMEREDAFRQLWNSQEMQDAAARP